MENEQKHIKNTLQNNDKMDWRPMIFFYVKTTSWIILPLIFSLFAGSYVSKTFGSQFLYFTFVMLGFGITCFGIYREVKVYKKSIDKMEELVKLKESNLNNK